ncbi:MAG: hypothetical protein HFH84_12015 [Lachnospiraceae bacterium]|nr:hypothetical protein [Lachnospiraceae bacterium]
MYWKDKAAVRSIQTGVFFGEAGLCEGLEVSGRGISWGRGRAVLRMAEGTAALRLIKI